MINLKEFDFRPHPAGFQAVAHFGNGFGVSIIPESDMTHYELAVMRGESGARSHVCYDSGITDDVMRYLTVNDVHNVVFRVRNLKAGTRVTPPHPFVIAY